MNPWIREKAIFANERRGKARVREGLLWSVNGWKMHLFLSLSRSRSHSSKSPSSKRSYRRLCAISWLKDAPYFWEWKTYLLTDKMQFVKPFKSCLTTFKMTKIQLNAQFLFGKGMHIQCTISDQEGLAWVGRFLLASVLVIKSDKERAKARAHIASMRPLL